MYAVVKKEEVSPVASGQSARERDRAYCHRTFPWEENRRVDGRLRIIDLLMSNDPDFDEKARKIASEFGLRKYSRKSAYRWAADFNPAMPYSSLVDKRLKRRVEAQGLANNKEFVAYLQELMVTNKRKTAPAVTELFERLKAGDAIPGFGDWRDIYALEHGGIRPAPDMACPYDGIVNVPKGWTLRNLSRLKPSDYLLVAMRKGGHAAKMRFMPEVFRTRVGMKSCAVINFDDVVLEHKVSFRGNVRAERMTGFDWQDVKTGHIICHLIKPIREREDGTKEHLRSKWARYGIAHILCNVGIPEEGVIFQGEHGTASLPKKMVEDLHDRTDGLVQFRSGGLFDKPLAAGLYKGRPIGNPRAKGLLEGWHAPFKNLLANYRGQMGGGRGEAPEWVAAMDREDEKLRAIAAALERERPGIGEKLIYPYCRYEDFCWVLERVYDILDNRRGHHMEGWRECGFETLFFKESKEADFWHPVSELDGYVPQLKEAILDALRAGTLPAKYVQMSPAEAWAASAGDRTRFFPQELGMEIMGMDLARQCYLDDQLKMHYKDDETLADLYVRGMLAGGHELERGRSYLVWVNPCCPDRATVADLKGRYLGLASVVQRAAYNDDDAIKRQLGIHSAALAAEHEKALPVLRRLTAARAAEVAHNATVILGEDPALKAARQSAAAHELEKADAPSLEDMPGADRSDEVEDIPTDDLPI